MKKLILSLALLTIPAMAVWQNPTPVCIAQGDQSNLIVGPYGNGGVLILWEDQREGWPDVNIYGQVLDAEGNSLWPENGLPIIEAENRQEDVDALVLGNGDIIVTWHDSRVSGQTDIYAQRVGLDGSLKWGDLGVPICEYEENQTYPHLCPSGDGAIVTWSDYRYWTDQNRVDIRAQRVNGEGQILWADTGLVISQPSGGGTGAIITDGCKGAFISYWKYGLYVQRVDSLGNLLWGTSGTEVYPGKPPTFLSTFDPKRSLIPDGDGGVILAYSDTLGIVRVQRVDSSGNIMWADTGVTLSSVNISHDGFNICPDGKGGVIGLWYENGSYYDRVWANRVDSTGQVQWEQDGNLLWEAVRELGGHDEHIVGIPDGSGGAEFVFIDWGDTIVNPGGIISQRVNESGEIQWGAEGVKIVETGTYPQIVSDDNSGCIVVWQDRSGGDWDIYAAHIDSLGNIGGVSETPPEIERPFQITAGFNPSQVSFTLGEAGFVGLELYDVCGRLVRPLLKSYCNVGEHIIPIEREDLPPAVYFIRGEVNRGNKKIQTATTKIVVVK